MSKLSDYYIRKTISTPISKKICFLSPNFVTFINMFVGFFIIMNLRKNKSYKIMIMLAFLNRYLDMLDGDIARNCNKKSKFGAIFDITSDIVLILFYYIYILHKTYKSNQTIHFKILIYTLLVPLILLCVYTFLLELSTDSWINTMNNDKHKNFLHRLILFYRDNAFLFWNI